MIRPVVRGGGRTYLKQDLFHSRMIRPVVGGGRPARRQTGVSQRGQAGFQRSRPPDTPHLTIGTTPPGARASRPHAVPSVAAQFPCDVAADRPAGGNRMGPAEAEAGRRCRLIRIPRRWPKLREDLCGRDARAPGWASSHDRVTPTGQKCRSILAPVVPSVLVIRVHWWFVFIDTAVFPLSDPPRRGGGGRGKQNLGSRDAKPVQELKQHWRGTDNGLNHPVSPSYDPRRQGGGPTFLKQTPALWLGPVHSQAWVDF